MRVRARGSRPSGHVDEALFTTRIPRHYFHSTHSHTGTSSQSYTGMHSHSHLGTHSLMHTLTVSHWHTLTVSHCHTLTVVHCHTLTVSHCHTLTVSHRHTHFDDDVWKHIATYYCFCFSESSKLPYQHWSISVADRQSTSDVGSQENSTLGDTQDKSTPSGTQKMLSGFDHQQQRVVEWLKGQEMLDTSVTATDDKHANSVTHSLPRPLKRSQTLESHFSRQHPTRTFSYIQAQVSI